MAKPKFKSDDLALFPADAQARIRTMSQALDAAIVLANDAGESNLLGILDLVNAELNRMNDEVDEIADAPLEWVEPAVTA